MKIITIQDANKLPQKEQEIYILQKHPDQQRSAFENGTGVFAGR